MQAFPESVLAFGRNDDDCWDRLATIDGWTEVRVIDEIWKSKMEMFAQLRAGLWRAAISPVFSASPRGAREIMIERRVNVANQRRRANLLCEANSLTSFQTQVRKGFLLNH